MEKEFVPYKQALVLKELGFNEPCFGYYYTLNGKDWKFAERTDYFRLDDEINIGGKFSLLALTFSQAFNFLLEKYSLYAIIIPTVTMHWTFKTMTIVNDMIETPPYKNVDGNDYNTFKEAELACLTKLIEIVKTK